MVFTPFPGFCETYYNTCNGDAIHNIVLYYNYLYWNTPCREEALADKETRVIRQKRRFDAIIAAVKIVIAYQQSWSRCKAWVFYYQKFLQQKFLRINVLFFTIDASPQREGLPGGVKPCEDGDEVFFGKGHAA